MKKILIRVIGALCILGAAALMFFPSWLTIEGVKQKEFRAVRSDICGSIEKISDAFLQRVMSDEDFQDDLEDYDLPHTRGEVKARFREMEDLAKELVDDQISLQELTKTAFMLPGIMTDLEGLLDSGHGSALFGIAAGYVVYEGAQAMPDAPQQYTEAVAEALQGSAENAVESFGDYSFLFIIAGILLAAIPALGAVSAVTHVCNKGRWLKYIFLLMLVVMVAGSCVALPMVTGVMSGAAETVPMLEQMSLHMALAPFAAVLVMFIPIVLDIIYERKKIAQKVEG